MADAPIIYPDAPAPAPTQIPVINPEGVFGYLPSEQWDDSARIQGYRLASPEDVQKAKAQAAFGNVPGMIASGTLGAARALTLGLSDQALTKTGLMEPEVLKGLQEANPVSSGVGTAIGIAAPLLLTGGAAAPAEAGALGATEALARASAPAVISRVGQAVTRGVEGLLPEASGTLGKIVTKAVSSGLGSAVEGAAYGAGQVVSEEALGDPNLTAQSALATVGLSAALGGGIGSALGIAHEAVPVAIQKARDAIGGAFGKLKGEVENWYQAAENVHGVNPATAQLILEHKIELSALENQAPGITETLTKSKPAVAASIIDNVGQFGALEREFPGISKTLSKTRPDTLSLILQNPEFANLEREFPGTLRQLSAAEPGTAQYLADNWPKIIRDPNARAALSESIRKSGQEIIDSTNAMFKKAYGEMLPGGADTLLADANPAAVMDAYSGFWAKAADAIGQMESRPSLFDKYYPARLRVILEDLMKDTGRAENPVAAFQHLTRLRQEIGDMVSWGKTASLPPAERDAQQLIKGLYRDVSGALRSEETFGAAGARKAALDDAFAAWKRVTERRPGAMLGKSEAGTSNFNFLLMQSGRLSPNKMNQWFKHLADDTGALKTEAWSHMMDAARGAADAVDELHQAAPVVAFNKTSVTDLIDRTAKLTEDARQKFAASQVMEQLNPRLARSMHEALAAAPSGAAAQETLEAANRVAAMAGHGPIVSTVKAVLSPITSAVETARSFPKGVAVLASLERMGQRISSAIDSGASMLVRSGSRAENVGRSEIVAGLAREFAASPEDAVRRFTRRVTEVQQYSQNADKMNDALAQNRDLDQHAPNTAQALSIASARAVSFLDSKIPRHDQAGPLSPKWAPTRSEMSKFARYYEAVQDPLVILKQAAAGTLTPEAVEAVQAVYPELYAKVRSSIVEKIATHGTAIPARSRTMLSALLGEDLDGRMSMLLRNQATHQAPSRQTQNAAPQAVKPTAGALQGVTVATRMATPMQASAQRRGAM